MERLDPANLPAPKSAQTAALATEAADLPPIRHGRRRARAPKITWRGIFYMFFPHLALVAAGLIAAFALWKGRS